MSSEAAALRVADAAPTPRPSDASDIDFRAILERIPAVTYVAALGASGEWLYVSPQIEPMLGYTAEEWTADPHLWFRQIHPEDRGQVLEDENFCKANGEPLCSEYRMIARDGRQVWVRDEARPVPSQHHGLHPRWLAADRRLRHAIFRGGTGRFLWQRHR